MNLEFWKYHGAGNDFVIVREEALLAAGLADAEISAFTKSVCARTTGIGADGVLVAHENPFEMKIFNSDGTSAPMCGNGIRCFAAFLADEGLQAADEYIVKTGAGDRLVKILSKEPFLCEINMGSPDFSPATAGIAEEAAEGCEDFLNKQVRLSSGEQVIVNSFFMGTYHTVVWLGEGNPILPAIDDDAALEKFGREIQALSIFTKGTNVDMAQIVSRNEIKLRTYERGAGLTAACGTGACAAATLAYREGKTDAKARVLLPFGELKIRTDEDGCVYMAGSASRIAHGMYYY